MHKSQFIQTRTLNLRRNLTEAEKLLWLHLRNNNIGCKFRRQQAVDQYIVDFVCFEKRLIVELDGGQHTLEKDDARTAYLEQQGFTVLRFWNNDVLQNIEGVVQVLQRTLTETPSPAREELVTSPARGEVRK